MADNKANRHRQVKRGFKKTTSKRRVMALTLKESEPPLNNNSTAPKSLVPIQERTVIGQENPSKPTNSLRHSIQNILNRTKVVQFNENERSEADGREDNSTSVDAEAEALSRLRCPSECTEAIAEREKRRRQRCADYPGLAFGSSIFSSDTLMKFSIIRNELHNILKSQLKRAETEVFALNRRIKSLEEELKRSEQGLTNASTTLAEATHSIKESERAQRLLEDGSELEENKVALLESQLMRANLMAKEADKKCGEASSFYNIYSLVILQNDIQDRCSPQKILM